MEKPVEVVEDKFLLDARIKLASTSSLSLKNLFINQSSYVLDVIDQYFESDSIPTPATFNLQINDPVEMTNFIHTNQILNFGYRTISSPAEHTVSNSDLLRLNTELQSRLSMNNRFREYDNADIQACLARCYYELKNKTIVNTLQENFLLPFRVLVQHYLNSVTRTRQAPTRIYYYCKLSELPEVQKHSDLSGVTIIPIRSGNIDYSATDVTQRDTLAALSNSIGSHTYTAGGGLPDWIHTGALSYDPTSSSPALFVDIDERVSDHAAFVLVTHALPAHTYDNTFDFSRLFWEYMPREIFPWFIYRLASITTIPHATTHYATSYMTAKFVAASQTIMYDNGSAWEPAFDSPPDPGDGFVCLPSYDYLDSTAWLAFSRRGAPHNMSMSLYPLVKLVSIWTRAHFEAIFASAKTSPWLSAPQCTIDPFGLVTLFSYDSVAMVDRTHIPLRDGNPLLVTFTPDFLSVFGVPITSYFQADNVKRLYSRRGRPAPEKSLLCRIKDVAGTATYYGIDGISRGTVAFATMVSVIPRSFYDTIHVYLESWATNYGDEINPAIHQISFEKDIDPMTFFRGATV